MIKKRLLLFSIPICYTPTRSHLKQIMPMASFELTSFSCDGHIKALSKAILMASKISKEALLEFTPDKMRICARTDLFLVKFIFTKDFFSDYRCDTRHRCYINLKALLGPFKSSILCADRDGSLRSQIAIRCSVEDELYNQIVFKVGADPPAATLTYKLSINDLDPERMSELNAINRTIDYARVEITPKQNKKERFLLSAFNSFAPDIDQVTIKTNQLEVKFIGSSCPLLASTNTTSEFTHKREEFCTYAVKEDVNITIPLRYLKLFLSFIETNKVQTFPKYIFEGMGLPAHFIYDAQLFRGHFVSATPYEYIPPELGNEEILAIDLGPNDSFLAEESVIQQNKENDDDDFLMNDGEYHSYLNNPNQANEEDLEDEDDGYNDNDSETSSDYLDGNLDGLAEPTDNRTALDRSLFDTTGNFYNNSITGGESIRSEMRCKDPEEEDLKLILGFEPGDESELEKNDVTDIKVSWADEDE